MKPLLRTFASLVVLVVAVWLTHEHAVKPYYVNRAARRIHSGLQALAGRPSQSLSLREILRLRADGDVLRRALEDDPTNLVISLQLASIYKLLGRNEDAVTLLRSTLRFHRRPEIYLGLGDLQIETGNLDDAVDSYAQAVAFSPHILDETPEALRPHIRRRAVQIYGAALDLSDLMPANS